MRHASSSPRDAGRILAAGVAAAFAVSMTAGPAYAHARDGTPHPASGTLTGRVIDVRTREPIGWATLVLVEIQRGEISHADGSFHFHDIPSGRYSLKISHLGYRTEIREVTIGGGDTAHMTIELTATPLQGQPAVVISARDGRAFTPSETLSGTKLQQRLGRSLAETLGSEAGVSQRSMGPAPARPVIRGLGGDRLLILQDGDRTGDLSATSADHAVTVDPLAADRVEIVQGPASLLYTANALGGVVNVISDRIASTLPDRVHGMASIQGETVNSGGSAGLSLSLPAGPLAVQFEGTGRTGSDITTPAGDLRNTSIDAYNGSAGISLVESWGYAGVGASTYATEYGIPGGFVGAHPNGVRVRLDNRRMEVRGEMLPAESMLRRVEVHAAHTRYHHQELESNGSLGAEFGVLTTEGGLTFHHGEAGPFDRGAIGAWGEYVDFAAGGATHIPKTTEGNLAAFLYEEMAVGNFTVQGSLRGDFRSTTPATTGPSGIGDIRERTFAGAAGSASILYPVTTDLQAGLTFMRSFRPPTIEELFSEGPHLAAYSFETGNPDLGDESGLGMELLLRYSGTHGHANAAVFRNTITGYIYPRNTGDTSFRTQLPIYQYAGADAIMEGAELSGEFEPVEGIVAGATMSYVRGTLRDDGLPLPMIPPLNGRINIRYQSGPLTLGAAARWAADQNRPGEFEERTAGYIVYDAFAQYQYITSSLLHTMVLTLENATDAEYRMHLSRVKSIMPEPGRNLKLLYRLYF